MLNPFNFTIAYSPMNDKLEELMQNASVLLDLEVIGLENATELERYAMDNNLLCGIEFNDTLSDITELPENITYSIRFPSELRVLPAFLQPIAAFAGNWRTEILFDKFLGNRPRNLNENDGGTPSGYAREGFLEVQNAIERSFISIVSNVDFPEVSIQRYPYPAFILDPVLQAIEMFLPILMVLSFLFVSINTIKVQFKNSFGFYHLLIAINTPFSVHHCGKRETTKRGYEDYGTSKLASLDGLVHKMHGFHVNNLLLNNFTLQAENDTRISTFADE